MSFFRLRNLIEVFEHFVNSRSIVCLLCHLGEQEHLAPKENKTHRQFFFFAHVTSVKFLIYDPRQCIAVKAKKWTHPVQNKQMKYITMQVIEPSRNTVLLKKRAVLTSFLFVRQGTSEVSELYTIKTKQIKVGHLDLLNRTLHKQETFL